MGKVTAAASVFFFRPEYDEFLYAAIGAEGTGMPLSVLSALSRLNIDPWEEAADLSELPAGTATERLASLIARLPGGRWAAADSQTIAGRLIKLLPRRSRPTTPAGEKIHGFHAMTGSTFATILLCVALGLAGLLIAVMWERSRGDDGAAPTVSTASPPQISAPGSR